MARYDDLNTKTIGYLTFMSTILLVVTVLLLQALCYNWIDWQEEDKLLNNTSYKSADGIIKQQKDSLTGYSKVSEQVAVEPPKGDGKAKPDGQAATPAEMKTIERIRIPIDQAEKLMLDEWKASGQPAGSPST